MEIHEQSQEKVFGTFSITPATPSCINIYTSWAGDYKSYHSNEFIFVLEGECILTINGSTYIVTKNQLAFIPKHASFSHRLTSKKKLTYSYAVIDAVLEGKNFYDLLGLSEGNYVVTVPNSELMRSIIENFSPGYKDFYSYRLYMCAQLTQILAVYVECRMTTEHNTIDEEWMPVIEYMKENLTRTVSVDELAKTIHMPVSTFKRKFQKAFTLSPMRYFDTLRIEKIVDLICKTDWPISKIARHVGFENKYYFAKFFSKHLYVTPEEYAETFRNEKE